MLVCLLAVACGGEIEPTNPALPEPVTDLASADFLPTGAYTPTISAASCNVNAPFQRGDPMLLVRRGTSVNMPIPFHQGTASEPSFGAPRQDRDLGRKTMKWTSMNEGMCPGGSILVTMTMTDLTPSRVAFEYREEPRDCVHATCTVEVAFDLERRACLPTTHPDCVPGRARMDLGGNAFQEVDCTCAP